MQAVVVVAAAIAVIVAAAAVVVVVVVVVVAAAAAAPAAVDDDAGAAMALRSTSSLGSLTFSVRSKTTMSLSSMVLLSASSTSQTVGLPTGFTRISCEGEVTLTMGDGIMAERWNLSP